MKTKFVALAAGIVTAFTANAQKTLQSTTPEVHNFYETAQSGFNSYSIPKVPSFERKAETVGNQYLFEDWVSGVVVNIDGVSFGDGYLFNYNKLSQNLYVKVKDTAAAFLVNKHQLKSIWLTDGTRQFLLERVAAIDSNYFYNAIVKSNKYSLYSLTKTKFIASNYVTNGMTSSGNLYDEFKDEVVYYIVFPDGTAKTIPSKKKAIKSLFEADKEKVEEFYKNNDNANNSFGESFLKSLVEYLNP
jgi:hypothetical protein